MKIAIILGTRPEIIKMCPIIRACEKNKTAFYVIHTGQHYSYEMDKIFFEELELQAPRYNLEVGSGSHGKQTGLMLEKIEEILVKDKPDVVLVEGDTNTVLAGALAAAKLHIKVGHVEAGLRSFDRNMPEEINRIMTDHISDYLFAPTAEAESMLLKEGIPKEKIFVTGNTIVDSVFQNKEIAKKKSRILEKLPQDYILVTAHRAENTDDAQRLIGILKGLELVSSEFNKEIIYPIHPRTKKMMETYNITAPKGIRLMQPVGFIDFLTLESNASLVLTDSGGVQEETCILKVPCVTLRNNTERPETIKVGGNILAGTQPDKILETSKIMLKKNRDWVNPFGDGNTGKIILGILNGRTDKR